MPVFRNLMFATILLFVSLKVDAIRDNFFDEDLYSSSIGNQRAVHIKLIEMDKKMDNMVQNMIKIRTEKNNQKRKNMWKLYSLQMKTQMQDMQDVMGLMTRILSENQYNTEQVSMNSMKDLMEKMEEMMGKMSTMADKDFMLRYSE